MIWDREPPFHRSRAKVGGSLVAGGGLVFRTIGYRDGRGPTTGMGSTTLITGGAGFIGCAVADALLGLGDGVVLLDNLHPQVHAGSGRPQRVAPDTELLPVDVTSAANWDAVLR